jgi:hypothetical protein
MPDPVSRLRLARDEIDKTFGVGFAASRACCRRLGGRLTAPPAHRNHCNGHPSSDAVLVPAALRGRRGVTVRFTMVERLCAVRGFFTGNCPYMKETVRIGRTPEHIGLFAAIGQETAARGIVTIGVDRGQTMACRQRDDLIAMDQIRDVRQHQQPAHLRWLMRSSVIPRGLRKLFSGTVK